MIAPCSLFTQPPCCVLAALLCVFDLFNTMDAQPPCCVLAALLSVFDLFNTMDESFRMEAASLTEYMYCPEGINA